MDLIYMKCIQNITKGYYHISEIISYNWLTETLYVPFINA